MLSRNPSRQTSRPSAALLSCFKLLVGLVFIPGCSPDTTRQTETSKDTPLISLEETRQIGMHILLNRHPKAAIVSERDDGSTVIYRFSTNDVVAPVVVIVDKRTSKARFEKTGR
jgi:hypothetical protein